MPRSYGITNAAPYAAAPTVGAAGDMYYNTATKVFYISDGTTWLQIVGSGGGGLAYAEVQSTAPNANSPPAIVPPMGLLWVDTSVTAASFIGPSGLPDGGIVSTSPDLNTYQTSGIFSFTGSPTNAPPFPAGAFLMQVSVNGNGTYILQEATLISTTRWVANRVYTGTWSAWQLVSKPLAVFRIATTSGQSIPVTTYTQLVNFGSPEYNIGGGTWNADSTYSVPRTAVYIINGAVHWYLSGTTFSTPNNDFMSWLYVAGSGVGSGSAYLTNLTTGTFNVRAHMSITKIITAGQKVDIRAWQNGPVAYTANTGSFLEVIELSQATS